MLSEKSRKWKDTLKKNVQIKKGAKLTKILEFMFLLKGVFAKNEISYFPGMFENPAPAKII